MGCGGALVTRSCKTFEEIDRGGEDWIGALICTPSSPPEPSHCDKREVGLVGEGKTGSFVIARAGAVQCSYSDRRGGREGRERERERDRPVRLGCKLRAYSRTTLARVYYSRSSINI